MDKKQCAMTRYLAEKNTLGPEISRDTILSLLDYIEILERSNTALKIGMIKAVETIEWMHECTAPADDEVEKAIRDGKALLGEMK